MRRETKRYTVAFVILAVLLVSFVVWNLNAGSYGISVAQVMQIFLGNGSDATASRVVWDIRLPRVLAAILLGGALSVAGFLLQTFFANPIAGPFVLGISSGAKLVVAMTMIFFLQRGLLSNSVVMIAAAFVGAMLSMAFVLLVAILLVCILAPVVAPYDPNAQDLTQVLAKPSAAHWLGCDQTGRDIFSRIIYGGRTALVSAVMVVVISVIIGIPLGLISGYKGGLADTIIMRCCDILLSFPSLLLAFVLVAGLGRNTFNAVLALGIVYVPMLTRLTRSLTLVEKNKVYVSACVSLGYSDTRILYRHILPNCISTILVQLTLDVAYAILDLASLSFLGLGVKYPFASWGNIINDVNNAYVMTNYLFIWIPAGVCLLLTVLGFNFVGDGLRDAFDPKMKR